MLEQQIIGRSQLNNVVSVILYLYRGILCEQLGSLIVKFNGLQAKFLAIAICYLICQVLKQNFTAHLHNIRDV